MIEGLGKQMNEWINEWMDIGLIHFKREYIVKIIYINKQDIRYH